MAEYNVSNSNQSGYAQSFRELRAYQASSQLAADVFAVTQSFPREETYALTDQIRRSSRSIGAQIAEAWGKRRYEKHFVSKLTDADAEQLETQHWIDTAAACGYLNESKADELREQCAIIGRMLGKMMSKSDLFCGNPPRTIRELPIEYQVHTE